MFEEPQFMREFDCSFSMNTQIYANVIEETICNLQEISKLEKVLSKSEKITI
jgi:hypothetical protein